MEIGLYIVFFIMAVVAVGCDIKRRRIPNTVIILGVLSAMGVRLCSGTATQAGVVLVSMSIPFVLFFPIYKLGMMGAGDVKFLCMFSVLLSWEQVIYFLFYACLLGAVWSLLRMIGQKSFVRRFAYFGDYIIKSVKSGTAEKYYTKEQGYTDTIAFALPIALSFLLHIGGVY